MVNNTFNSLYNSFFLGQNNQESDCFSSERIQSIIVNRYLSNALPSHQEDPTTLKDIKERLTSTFFDQYRLFHISEQPLTNDQIFDWFIKSDAASKLHRRAIEAGDLCVESFFRTSGVDVNQADKATGNTPLMLAARSHQPVLVRRLMQTGADALARNRNKESAIEQAIYQCHQKGYEKPQLLETLQHLLSDTRVFDLCTEKMMNIIFTETEREIAELFINHEKGSLRSIVAQLARSRRAEAPDILRLILEKFPRLVNRRDHSDKTPLMNAAEIGNRETMLAILDQPSIDIEAVLETSGFRSIKKSTAYSLAYGNGKNDCLQLLESYGAQKVFQGLTSSERLNVEARNESFYFMVKLVINLVAILGLYQSLKSMDVSVYINYYLICIFTYFSTHLLIILLITSTYFILDYLTSPHKKTHSIQ